MSVTRFPLARVQRLRSQAARAACLQSKVPEGWSKSAVDPMRLLAVFKSLRLKEGLILRADESEVLYEGNRRWAGTGFVF